MKYRQFWLISLLILLTTNNHAAVMLSGGLSHEYTVSPGGQLTGILELRNTKNEIAELKIYQEDIKIGNDGATEYVQAGSQESHPRSNVSWVSLTADRITLAPLEKRTLTYSVKVPNNNNLNGTYWSMLMLEPVSDKSPESQLQTNAPKVEQLNLTVTQKMRYAVQVLTHIGGSKSGKSKLSFVEPKVENNINNSRILRFKIKNSGNRYSRPDVWLDVFNQKGKKLDRLKAVKHGLYAGEKEGFEIDLSSLKAEKYKCLLAAEDNTTGQIFGSDINLTIQPKI